MVIRLSGSAVPAVTNLTKSGIITDALPTIGNDLIAAYCPFLSPEHLPLTNIGGAIGKMLPFTSRRTLSGTFPYANGRGAILSESIGYMVADTTPGSLDLRAEPLNKANFGVGVLFYITPEFFNLTSRIIFGNAESGGATVGHGCAFTGAGSYQNGVTWDGITNSYYGANPVAFNRSQFKKPGWHEIVVDRSGGLAGLRVDGQDLITNTATGTNPTLTSFNLGNNISGGVSQGILYSAVIICDGQLAQNAARYAEWKNLTKKILSTIKS